jgi:hypothetical protein
MLRAVELGLAIGTGVLCIGSLPLNQMDEEKKLVPHGNGSNGAVELASVQSHRPIWSFLRASRTSTTIS